MRQRGGQPCRRPSVGTGRASPWLVGATAGGHARTAPCRGQGAPSRATSASRREPALRGRPGRRKAGGGRGGGEAGGGRGGAAAATAAVGQGRSRRLARVGSREGEEKTTVEDEASGTTRS